MRFSGWPPAVGQTALARHEGLCVVTTVAIQGDEQPAEESMARIQVIGGGLAGPEAALTAARLGCEVDLYEMRRLVDGELLFDARAPDDRFRRIGLFEFAEERIGVDGAVAAEAGDAEGWFGSAAHCR